MGNETRIAVDLAKAVVEVGVSDRPGHVVRRERLPRAQFLPFMAQQPEATVVMEACGSAHYWGRRIQELGHKVVLLPPHHVRPYVRRNKTDRTDTKGILEASRNDDIRPVPVRTVAQQVITSLHRLCSGWMAERTARLDALRGLLRELGVFIPVGARQVVPAVWALVEDADSDLTEALRPIFAEACLEIRQIEARVKQVERQLQAMTKRHSPGTARAKERDGGTGRTGARSAENNCGPRGRCHRLAAARGFRHGPEPQRVSNEEAADTSAVRPVHTVAAALADHSDDQRT